MISSITDTTKPSNAPVGKNADAPKAIEINFENERIKRQKDNNDMLEDTLMNNDLETFKKSKYLSTKAWERTLDSAKITPEDFHVRCKKDSIYRKSIIPHISKTSSRQGILDEMTQLSTCKEIAKECGIQIDKLDTSDCIPTKKGEIVSRKGAKKQDCLKSFDG